MGLQAAPRARETSLIFWGKAWTLPVVYWGQAEAASHDVGPEQAPCVVVPVDDMELVTAVGTEAGAWPQFEVRTRDQVLHRFAAIDAATRQGWIDVLGRMIAEVERAKGLDVQAALTAPGTSGKS